MFGPARNKVRREWRRLHNEELYAVYAVINIIWMMKSRRMEWARHVTRMGDRRDAYGVVVKRPEGRRPLRRPRNR